MYPSIHDVGGDHIAECPAGYRLVTVPVRPAMLHAGYSSDAAQLQNIKTITTVERVLSDDCLLKSGGGGKLLISPPAYAVSLLRSNAA